MPELRTFVTEQGMNRLARRQSRSLKMVEYFTTVEIAALMLRIRRDELDLQRDMHAASDPTEKATLANALARQRQLMIELCQVPKRPASLAGKRQQVPEITLEPAAPTPQDTP